MMKLNVKEVGQAKGYKNAKQLTHALSEHFGVKISFSTIYPLWDDTAQLWSRQTIDRLCEFLQVPAGLLIQHMPGGAQQSTPEAGQAERSEKVASRAATSKRKRERAKEKHTTKTRNHAAVTTG